MNEYDLKNGADHAPPRSRPSRVWIWLIAAFALGLRLYGLTSPLYDLNYWRQTETAAIAWNYYHDGLPFLSPEIDWMGPHGRAEMELPLFPWLVSLAYRASMPWDGYGRVLSILCSLGALAALYAIVRRRFDEWSALFAAACFAAAPVAVFFGRTFQPDMMMVCASLWALAWLIQWNGALADPRWVFSALSLTLCIALKPTGLIVALPITAVFFEKRGWRILLSPVLLGYAVLTFLPAALWYWRAHGFYEETGATFIRHYIGFSLEHNFLQYLRDPAFWPTVTRRVCIEILVYAGVPLALLGVTVSLRARGNRCFSMLWMLGVVALYLGVPGHHLGHQYYSLPAVPPLAMFAGVGLAAIGRFLFRKSSALLIVVPLAMGGYGLWMTIQQGWYSPLYLYYHDAVELRDELPDGPIAVMDELLHTPEFFYFARRDGWHRMRNANDWIDDSAWVEEVRQLGAAAYVGLNESFANHPIKYLETHPTGQYIWSHYDLFQLGFRHFAARLDRPVFGDYLAESFREKSVAMPDSAAMERAWLHRLALQDWSRADAILLDLHQAQPQEKEEIQRVYDDAVSDGFAVVRQDGGRWYLQKSDDVGSATHALDFAVSSEWLGDASPFTRYSFGMLDAGRYRISVRFDRTPDAPVRLYAMTPDGEVRSSRELEASHLALIEHGERPTLFLRLLTPATIIVGADANGEAIPLRSAVCAPDVQCIQPGARYQAESLLLDRAKPVYDPDAERESALWAWSTEEGRFFCHGPFFQLPDGHYRGTFRLRSAREWSEGDVVVGFHENNLVWQAVTNMYTPLLSDRYTNLNVEADIPETYIVETRGWLYPHTEIMLDTIRIDQLRRDSIEWKRTPVAAEYAIGDSTRAVLQSGVVTDASGTYRFRVGPLLEGAAAVLNDPDLGLRVVDAQGRVFDASSALQWAAPWSQSAPIVKYAASSDGAADAFVANDGVVYHHQARGRVQVFPIETRPMPVRQLIVYSDGAHVLFGNGFVASAGSARRFETGPDFGSDAARALVVSASGGYVVDCRGAIHSLDGAPKINTPYYREEDWIEAARRSPDGEWTFVTKEGEEIQFHE
ncbi:MAG: hypothetical protein GC154_19855 [bacterium]|nr:hypothetical protein [bacterium]